ncbi:unnamed protein product [Durusdinium trenchii]|uniref:Uncharacterized protein n=1 Tax=Durusdinium trenchii TaxID=1381693 RepID=A0ABP0QHH0_9DINO
MIDTISAPPLAQGSGPSSVPFVHPRTLRRSIQVGRGIWRFTVLALHASNASNTSASLLLAEPLTARTHQLRAHLAAAGWPIVVPSEWNTASASGTPDPATVRKPQHRGIRPNVESYQDPTIGVGSLCIAPSTQWPAQ